MRKQKVFSAVLCAAAFTMVVTGCGNSTTDTTTEATQGSSTEQTTVSDVTEQETEETTEEVTNKDDDKKVTLSYDGYTLKFEDEFEGDSLNMDNWNYEYHDPGWVNNELQAYVDAAENVYVKDGVLTIQAIKSTDEEGNTVYTSGRVNTQNKQDYTYGIFEVKAKVPSGKGFLPAAWMMPTDENLYGQWPKCGEIDIMEVLGDQTARNYSTIHYGEPHTQSQGSYILTGATYAEDYHVFTCEWEPSVMKFYVDGVLIHEENDWFTKQTGYGEVTYPAPFDQPFYMILNLAVGGDWPGNPDDSTQFGDNAQLNVDYVRIYQKDSYDTNVEKPAKETKFREPDADGNYIHNGNFETEESLSDTEDWYFLTAGEGKATCSISDGAIHVDTEKCGELDYSVQLVQPGLPIYQGASYKITFDAYADEARTGIVAVTAPNVGWIRYFNDTYFDLTTEKQTYTYEFTVTEADDDYGRLEFNLGNQNATASVHISNVSVVMTEEGGGVVRSCLPDGNYVYNGKFQEGPGRIEYWTVESGNASVTNDNTVRELVTDGAAVVSQEGIVLATDKEYFVTLDVSGKEGEKLGIDIADNHFDVELGAMNTYKFVFTPKTEDAKLTFTSEGSVHIDNVAVKENALLVNGDFAGGMTGYEVYAYTSSDVNYVVDSLNEDMAFCIDIMNTGDQDWKIQLKQNNILLEEGKSYRISFDAKCDKDRVIMYALQRDGSSDDNWVPYSDSQFANLTGDYQHFSTEFKMEYETDKKTILSISMGSVQGTKIEEKHTVVIDNIVLEEI